MQLDAQLLIGRGYVFHRVVHEEWGVADGYVLITCGTRSPRPCGRCASRVGSSACSWPTAEDVGFYANNAKFLVEKGTIEVYVGNSSAAELTSSFTVV